MFTGSAFRVGMPCFSRANPIHHPKHFLIYCFINSEECLSSQSSLHVKLNSIWVIGNKANPYSCLEIIINTEKSTGVFSSKAIKGNLSHKMFTLLFASIHD